MRELRTLAEIILSAPRMFLSGCCKARFAGNGPAIAKERNAAAAAQEQPNAEIISVRVLSAPEAAALHAQQAVQLLDVREPWEHELCHITGDLHIPMGQIPERLADIPQHRPLIVVCHHGMRSYQVAEFLLARGFADVANLDGGIDAWARAVDPTLARY